MNQRFYMLVLILLLLLKRMIEARVFDLKRDRSLCPVEHMQDLLPSMSPSEVYDFYTNRFSRGTAKFDIEDGYLFNGLHTLSSVETKDTPEEKYVHVNIYPRRV